MQGKLDKDATLPLFLFALVVEALASKIWYSQKVVGISFGGQHRKVSLFTDDLLLTLTYSMMSLLKLVNLLDYFGLTSGFRTNKEKSDV